MIALPKDELPFHEIDLNSQSTELENIIISQPKKPHRGLHVSEELLPGISPLILEEPIQVLMLSPSVEKMLISFNKTALKDLLQLNAQEWVLFKGVGQERLEEIHDKLDSYLKSHAQVSTKCIDFASLIRVLVGSCQRKQAFILLDLYGLSDLIAISQAEKGEIRRLTPDEKIVICHHLKQELKASEVSEKLHHAMGEIVQVLVKPWMRQQEGLAQASELMEHFERISKEPSITPKVLKFICEVFLDESCVLAPFLEKVAREVYGVDSSAIESYQKLIQKVLTYFGNPKTKYSLSELVRMLQQEFAMDWEGVSEIFIRKALYFSSFFTISRNDLGQLTIEVALSNPSARKMQASHT